MESSIIDQQPHSPSRRPRILVVDDTEERSGLGQLLTQAGYIVDTAEDPLSALALVDEAPPDVVITNLRMPQINGLELIAELRARHLDAHLLVATAVEDIESTREAMRSGGADYLTKPIDADALIFALERAIQKLALERDAASLRERNMELAAEADQNLRAREELVSIVAHDLRGPLATITLAALAMANGDDDPQQKLGIIQRAAGRMRRLIDDLLDVAQIEMGRLDLQLSTCRASGILRQVVAELEVVAAQSDIRLRIQLGRDFEVRCAFERIIQVLVNLTANAVAVTPPGNRIRLRAKRRGDRAWFGVIDEGPGIAREDLALVFEHGWRGRNGRRHGAGLGLSIARGIVGAHGGKLDVNSDIGRGSTFHFTIPLCGPEHISWLIARRGHDRTRLC